MRFCYFLFISCLLDAVLTHLGIAFGAIEEANPIIMLVIQKSWILFYVIKLLLPLCLIGLQYLQPLKGRMKTLLVSTCVIYSSILLIHLAWIILFLNTPA